MLTFDASSIIHAWDNYPVNQFPPLWKWIESEITVGNFAISGIALDEVERKSPDCAEWLKDVPIQCFAIENAILQEAMRIRGVLGIRDDKYHPNGVGENDVLIIGTAKIRRTELVSEEGRQLIMPQENSKLKIPGVCMLPSVGVTCLSFIELIKRSKVVFG